MLVYFQQFDLTLHSDELAVPVFSWLFPSEEENSNENQENDEETQEILAHSEDPSYEASTSQQFSQPELNDFLRDLGLSKNVVEVLAFRL